MRLRDATRVKNPGGPVVMRRAAAARRRLLICQNLGGGTCPPAPPFGTCLVIIYTHGNSPKMSMKNHQKDVHEASPRKRTSRGHFVHKKSPEMSTRSLPPSKISGQNSWNWSVIQFWEFTKVLALLCLDYRCCCHDRWITSLSRANNWMKNDEVVHSAPC